MRKIETQTIPASGSPITSALDAYSLIWGIYYENGSSTAVDLPGAITFYGTPYTCYSVAYYKVEEETKPYVTNLAFVNENGFASDSCLFLSDIPSGTYYFTITPIDILTLSPVGNRVFSERWNYTAPPFKDVTEDTYYYESVLWAVENNITTGMTETTFAPDGTCTRAQIVTFLWRANGSPKPTSNNNPFTDVPAGQWYTDAVLWAVEKGITAGTSATTFSPAASCTRGQVATFLWRANGMPAANGNNIFNDIATGAYYYDAVLWAVANGITNGMGDGIFAPDATCTRGQIVTFLYRAMA